MDHSFNLEQILIKCTLRNGLKEYKRHGEVGSVDVEAVESERQRILKIVAKYPPEDCLNADESGLFPL